MRIFSTLLCITLFFSAGLIQAQVPDYVPKDGLIGWWPFNGNANDESGNKQHLTPFQVSFINDIERASVAKFNGQSWMQRDSLDDGAKREYTFSFWGKSKNKSCADIIAIACSTDCWADLRIQFNGSQCGLEGLSFKSPSHFATVKSDINDEKWHHYAVVLGSDNNYSFSNFKFYIDGVLITLDSNDCRHNWGGWKYIPDTTFPLSIGKGLPLGGSFIGLLDDVGIWNRALDSTEVAGLFKNNNFNYISIDTFHRAKITKAVNLGGNGKDNGLVVCEDYDKNILITGNYTNSIDVFPGDSILLLNSVGLQNSYLLKIDSNFNYIHSIPIQGDLITCTRNVTVDKYNNYYISGYFRRSITFKFPTKDTILRTPDNFSDVFIAKYNPNGILQWVRQLKGDSDDDVSGMKVSDDGVLFTTGYCEGTIDLNPSNGQDLYTTKGVDDAYVVKLNTDGEYISGFILGSSGNTYGWYILPDVDNQFYLSGTFSQSMKLVNQKNQVITLSSKGESDGFLIKYDSTNKAVWTNTLGGSRNDGIGQCSFDKEQNLVFASSFSDSINLKFNSNQITVKSKGDQDILLAKCDSAGNITWYSTIGSPKNDNLFHFSIDNNNFLHSYSKVNDSLIVSDSIIFLNTNDYYSLITYDSYGRMKKGYSIADFYGNWETPENGEYGYVFYPTRNSGELIASGFYTDSVRFYNESDSITLKSNGSTDAFVARLIIPKEIQLNCTYTIKESDTTVCPGTTVELNAIQSSSIKSEIPKDGLIGYWPFNGNANDESGNGNNGTVNGAILTTDRCGKTNSSYKFDGNDDFIQVASAEDLNLIGDFTLSAWISFIPENPVNKSYEHHFILSKNIGITGQGTWHWAIESANNSQFQMHYNADPCFCLETMGGVNSTPVPSKWTNVLVRYNDNSKLLEYFKDGKVVFSTTKFDYENKITQYPLVIGKSSNGIEGPFKGNIDDIAIWKRALTNAEIEQVYGNNHCGCEDTLSNDKFVWSDGQKGRKITVKPDTTTTYYLSVADGATLHRDSIKVTVGGDSCITCIYGIKQNDTTICQGTVLELNAEIDTVSVSIPKDGLIGWWPFNGNANDESGNGNHGIVDKATLTLDKNNTPNSAYRFYKSGSKIKIPDATMLNNPNLSMSFWVKTSDSTLHSYIYKSQEGTANNEEYGIVSNFTRNNTLEFSTKYGSNCLPAKGWQRNIKDTVIFDGKWHHISATYDGIHSKIYVDADLISEIQKPFFPIDSCPGGDILFGKGWNNDANLDGILDDIAIWNRAISHAEVKKMYELNRPKPAPSIPSDGLVGYWPFDGDAQDYSGNNNHGKVVGARLDEDRFGNLNKSYFLDGKSYIEASNLNYFNTSGEGSISFWMTFKDSFSPICKSDNSVSLDFRIQGNTNGLNFPINGKQYEFRNLKSYWGKSMWNHILLTFDNNDATLFVNGKIADSVVRLANYNRHSEATLKFGVDLHGNTENHNGRIDDVAFWNRQLSLDEVLNIYNGRDVYCKDTLPDDKFTWSTGQKGRKIAVTPNASTMYTLEVDRGKIIDRDTIHVTVLESPTPDIFGHVKVYERQINYSYYTPFNDSSTYEWSITGNGKLSSTNGGSSILVDFKEPGYAYLTVTETNKYGCKKDTTITIRIYRMTDIADSEIESEGLNIYPNPMNEFGSVMVKAYISPSKYASISVVDMLGKNVFTSELDGQDSYREIHVPISTESLTNGIYMIQLRIEGTVISKKLIINR